jgi:hypothetical protein
MVFTVDISKLINIPKSYFRFGYAKGFQYSEYNYGVQNAFVGASDNALKDTNVYGVFLETTLPGYDHSLMQLSYSKMTDIIANPLDKNTTKNTNIGDMDLFGAMIELQNIQDTNLDLFAHIGWSISSPNGDGYPLNPQGGNVKDGLLGKEGDTSRKNGHAYWLGGRYSMGDLQQFKLGFEYNHGSKNWINLTQGSFDIYNKLATRGDVYETYAMYVINRYANIRLGYITLKYNYTRSGWFVGEPQKVSSTAESSNALEKLDSIYLKLSVNF